VQDARRPSVNGLVGPQRGRQNYIESVVVAENRNRNSERRAEPELTSGGNTAAPGRYRGS
jgi:hypothetical protein